MYHKDEKKKNNHKIITILLVVFLLLQLYLFFSIFVSGPKYHYDHQIKQEMQVIYDQNKNLKPNLKRHVFQYITYIGEDDHNYYWYNQSGEFMMTKEKSSYPFSQLQHKLKQYEIKQYEIELGYGYHNAVIVITNDDVELLLDYDTLEEIYYLKKG